MNYKKCKIILLPTNDKLGSIKIHKETGKIYNLNMTVSSQITYKFHMYICLNEQATTNDLLYSYKYNKIMSYKEVMKYDGEIKSYYKVIATTDKSLGIYKIPKGFIDEFIKLKGAITDIFVEYKEHNPNELNVYNDTIFIYNVKSNFNFDEVVNILLTYTYSIGEYTIEKKDCIGWLIKNA